jgi:phenylalanyl-tRNA synthetase alpha chain
MLDRVENLKSQVEATALTTKEEAETFRLQYLSKKGAITELFKAFRDVPAE